MQDDKKHTEKLDQWISQNIAGAAGEKIVFEVATRAAPSPPAANTPPSRQGSTPYHKKAAALKRLPGNPNELPRTSPRRDVGPATHGTLRIIPLGGLDEVGKNMMIFEYERDIVIVDMGFQFPEEDMLGIDYVIPDVSYLMDKLDRIRGILITHGHLDHIGAIPYLLPKLGFPPIYSAKLTIGLVKKRLEEFGLERKAQLHEIDPAKSMRLGNFTVDWFRVNHSIPDGLGVILRTPAGTMVHTGDFKFDYTPVFQQPADYAKIAQLGSQNVIALFSDSTNALKPGYTMSEKKIGETLDEIIKGAKGRIIIAAFASLIGRIQQIINSAAYYNRKVFLSGRSMADNISIAQQLQFIKAPPGLLQPVNKIGKTKDEHTLILTTGAQGEAMSALTRMAIGDHSHVSIKRGDTIVLSSSPIPGNERSIYTVINGLVRLGAKVIFNQVMDVHTSGHAQREDLKLMINLVKPKYLIPIHGELFMRQAHAEIGRELGMAEKNTIILENGDVMEVSKGEAHKSAHKVSANYIMIDGKGVGDSATQIIMDRQIMAENGVLVVLFTLDAKTQKLVRDPEVISRGFIYMKEAQEIVNETVQVSKKAYAEAMSRMPNGKRGEIKAFIRGSLDRFSHRKIERHPLILPILVEI
ncbi:MAG: ribonuclease J [Patescibacteria group bacterium]